jgi:hypothetical protein
MLIIIIISLLLCKNNKSENEKLTSKLLLKTKGNRFSVLKQIQQKVIGNNANNNDELNTLKVCFISFPTIYILLHLYH